MICQTEGCGNRTDTDMDKVCLPCQTLGGLPCSCGFDQYSGAYPEEDGYPNCWHLEGCPQAGSDPLGEEAKR